MYCTPNRLRRCSTTERRSSRRPCAHVMEGRAGGGEAGGRPEVGAADGLAAAAQAASPGAARRARPRRGLQPLVPPSAGPHAPRRCRRGWRRGMKTWRWPSRQSACGWVEWVGWAREDAAAAQTTTRGERRRPPHLARAPHHQHFEGTTLCSISRTHLRVKLVESAKNCSMEPLSGPVVR